MNLDLGNIGRHLDKIFKTHGKELSPIDRANLNRANQDVKNLFKGQDLNDIHNVDVQKLTSIQDRLAETLEKLKNGSVSNNK